jgi:hypothetical protein
LIELSTGILFSFPADWRHQILKIVLVLVVVLVLDCWGGFEFEFEDEFEDD